MEYVPGTSATRPFASFAVPSVQPPPTTAAPEEVLASVALDAGLSHKVVVTLSVVEARSSASPVPKGAMVGGLTADHRTMAQVAADGEDRPAAVGVPPDSRGSGSQRVRGLSVGLVSGLE